MVIMAVLLKDIIALLLFLYFFIKCIRVALLYNVFYNKTCF